MNDSSDGHQQDEQNSRILKIPKRNATFTKKAALKKIIFTKKYNEFSNIVEDLANKINKLTTHAYQFLKCWILKKYHDKQNLPEINKTTLKLIFKVLIDCPIQKGKKLTGKKLELYNELSKFYDSVYGSTYSPFDVEKKIKIINSHQIVSYIITDMLTNIENNIRMHFFNYIKAFVNSSFKIDESDENIPKSIIYEQKQQLKKELYLVKIDFINNTLESDPKYHNWINSNRNKILPTKHKKTYEDDLDFYPQKYLKYMIYINIHLEQNGHKMYKVLPLRSESMIKYIPIDTQILINYFINDNRKDKYSQNISKYADELWKRFLKEKFMKKLNYKFNHLIYTDGIGVSINFVTNELYEKNITKFKDMNKGRTKKIANCKDMTDEEKEKYNEEFEANKKIKKDADKEVKKREKKISEGEYIKVMKREKTDEEKIKLQKEFPYLKDLTETQINKLKESNLVYVDPGKIRLYTMINDEGKVFKYSNREYMKRIKKDEYYKKLTKLRKKLNILENEKILSDYSSKTCNYFKFLMYVKVKNGVNCTSQEEYRNKIFRQYKWYSYIMKQRETSRLIKNIKETYGENCKLIMGDWCISKQMKHSVSTPMIGLKRKINKELEIINLDEFNTSKLNYITSEETKNLELFVYVPKRDEKKKIMRDENNKILKELVFKKIHSVLTYQMEPNRIGCINRDINSVKNMKKIVLHWFEHKERPIEYRRGNKVKLVKKVKEIVKKKKQVKRLPKKLSPQSLQAPPDVLNGRHVRF